jgi:hypothetical protein
MLLLIQRVHNISINPKPGNLWLGVHQYCMISTLIKDNVEDHKYIRVIGKVFQTQSPKPMFA